MTFGFGQLIAHLAKSRDLGAGTIVGSGTVSNKEDGGPGRPAAQGGVGYSCVAEQRTVETIVEGKPRTPFLRFGDRFASRCSTRRAARSSARSTSASADPARVPPVHPGRR
jgi:fumarylacetoacetate (FAA) hydrolase